MSAPNLPRLIGTIDKNSREHVRIVLDAFKGHHLCDMRVFASDGDGGDIPTKKGLNVRVDMLDELIVGLADAKAQALAMGWV